MGYKNAFGLLKVVLNRFSEAGIRTSVFVDPHPEMVEYQLKQELIVLNSILNLMLKVILKIEKKRLPPYVECANIARSCGIGLNAGHDLSLENLNYLYKTIPWIDEVSIGHALISDALYMGLEKTIQEYKNCLR